MRCCAGFRYLVAGHQSENTAAAIEGTLLQRTVSGSSYVLNQVTSEQLQDIWETYDADLDDALSRQELQSLLEDVSFLRAGHRNVDVALVDCLFDELDSNSDGLLDFNEFEALATKNGLMGIQRVVPELQQQ